MPLTAPERTALIERYARGPGLIRAALATVPADARQWRPGPGRWTVHEIVVHCADSEAHGALRIRILLAEAEPVIQAYDQDRWAAGLDYHQHPLDVALATVDAVRAHTLPLLRRMDDAAWARSGRHPETGPYRAEQWLRIYAEHLEKHAGQMERNLAAWRAR
jgi:hypothetical protein